MGDIQKKLIKGPAKVTHVHSSGKSVVVHEGKNVFLDDAIPGEEVTFLSDRRKQGFRSGETAEIVSSSPDRVLPFCIHHHQCNGCNWQHISYPRQLVLKQEILHNALMKYEIDCPEIPPVVPSPQLQAYRHRVEYTFTSAPYRATLSAGDSMPGPALGFHRNGEPGEVVDVKECFLQPEVSRRICDYVRSYALEHHLEFYDHQKKTGFLRSLSLRINRSGQALVVVGYAENRPAERVKQLSELLREFPEIVSLNWTVHLSPTHSQLQGEIVPFGNMDPYIYETLGNYRFRIHASSFFQPNARQAETIFRTISDWTHLTGEEEVYDLYTGIGTIALFLTPGARHITGIEGSSNAIQDAMANANYNGIRHADFIVGDILETFTPDFLRRHAKPDVIVLDPPRSGTLIEIKKAINLSGAGKVIYLSCNPVSLAFDLKQLTESYRVTRIQPFDMIPHTHHLETLVLLERK